MCVKGMMCYKFYIFTLWCNIIYPPQAALMMVTLAPAASEKSAHCVRGTILLSTAAATPCAGMPSCSMSPESVVACVSTSLLFTNTCIS